VDAEDGQQNLGGVVRLVQLPQRRDATLEGVVDPVAELVGEEQDDGHGGAGGEAGRKERRVGAAGRVDLECVCACSTRAAEADCRVNHL